MAEVILSAQFKPIANLTTAPAGILKSRFRDRLPLLEEHPPLTPASEMAPEQRFH